MINPYYIDEWVTIYHGDCREILPLIPDKSVDLVLTDPPYNVGRDYLGADDRRNNYIEWCLSWFSLLPKPIVMSVGLVNLPMWYKFVSPDWLFCWFKGNNMGSASKFTNIGLWEPFLMYGTPRIGVDGMYLPIVPQKGIEKNHDCPKPDKLISFIIGQFKQYHLLLDPFLGSGTTAYCAKKLNRKCIGIEIEEKYCEIAALRCSQGVFKLGI